MMIRLYLRANSINGSISTGIGVAGSGHVDDIGRPAHGDGIRRPALLEEDHAARAAGHEQGGGPELLQDLGRGRAQRLAALPPAMTEGGFDLGLVRGRDRRLPRNPSAGTGNRRRRGRGPPSAAGRTLRVDVFLDGVVADSPRRGGRRNPGGRRRRPSGCAPTRAGESGTRPSRSMRRICCLRVFSSPAMILVFSGVR